MDKYVIDAGPLIHLDQIGHLKIIKKLPLIFIPTNVIHEIKHDTNSIDLKSLEKWANIKIISPSPQISPQINTLIKKFPEWLSIEKAEDALNLLHYQSNLFITYAIIEQAIRSIKNSQ